MFYKIEAVYKVHLLVAFEKKEMKTKKRSTSKRVN
jgi:hypothetical protein